MTVFLEYLKDMFTLRQSEYSFRTSYHVYLCVNLLLYYGLNFFRYLASKNFK